MQEISHSRTLKIAFFIIAAIVFGVLAMRSWLVPFAHDEAATFFYYIQSGNFSPYQAHIDANNHVLNSGLSYYCFKLFGDSNLAMRLPNLLSFWVLVAGVYRISSGLSSHFTPRFLLIAGLLLSFNWLSFFSMTRGYGLSMAFFVLGLSFMLDYFRHRKIIFFYAFVLAIQLAIAANLTLIIVTILATLVLLIYQIFTREILKYHYWPGYLLHFFGLKYWMDFSFFLKENNALYYGEGESYSEVTFHTLIDLLTGWQGGTMTIYVIGCCITLFAIGLLVTMLIAHFRPQPIPIPWNFLKVMLMIFLFAGSVFSFFFLHLLMDVNYPEDRTALFFYPLFILMIVFILDHFLCLWDFKERKIFLLVPALFFVHFFISLNFKNHSIPEYETFPERFYTRLVEEQEKSKEKITVGGHRLTELMFAFMNYNHGAKLNPVDHGEEMNPFCDFAIAKKKDFDKFKNDYEIIDEADWDFVLLERKEKLHRNQIRNPIQEEFREGEQEYFEYLRMTDTSFLQSDPILVELELEVDHASQPFNGWMVLAIDDQEGKLNYYKRIPLNWLKYSWNQSGRQKIHFITGKMPLKVKNMVLFLWNHNKQFIKLKIHSMNFYQLSESIYIR